MKNLSKLALAAALIGGVSATALSVDTASAQGFGYGNNGAQQPQGFAGPRGGDFKGGMKGPKGGGLLAALDVDKDGTLTKDELTTGLEKKITDNDADGDGAVSLEEFKTEWEKITKEAMVRAYQHLDRDGDGKVTLEEISTPASAMFERMDRNEDGKLDKSDRPQRRFMSERDDRGGQKGPHGRGGPDGRQFSQNFEGQPGPNNGPQGHFGKGPHANGVQQGNLQPQESGPGFGQNGMAPTAQFGWAPQAGPQSGQQGGPQGGRQAGQMPVQANMAPNAVPFGPNFAPNPDFVRGMMMAPQAGAPTGPMQDANMQMPPQMPPMGHAFGPHGLQAPQGPQGPQGPMQQPFPPVAMLR